VVEIMLEMGILETDLGAKVFVPDNPPKVNLEDSEILKRIKSFI
jgi:hypothetical protein